MDAPSVAATELAELVDEGIEASTAGLATRQDVELVIDRQVNRLLRWMIGIGAVIGGAIIGLLITLIVRGLWLIGCGTLEHHAVAAAFDDEFAALIDASVLEGDDATVGAASRLAALDHFGFASDGVADEDWIGEGGLVEAEIAERCAQGRVGDAESDGEAEGEDAVDDPLTELGALRELCVEVQRLSVVCERGEEQVVGLGDSARRLVHDDEAGLQVFEPFSCHRWTPGSATELREPGHVVGCVLSDRMVGLGGDGEAFEQIGQLVGGDGAGHFCVGHLRAHA